MNLPTIFRPGNLHAIDPIIKAQYDKFKPIDIILDWFRAHSSLIGLENRFLVLKAETASGKSTGFVAELYKAMILPLINNPSQPGLICTQPRALTAQQNVQEIVYGADPEYKNFLKIGETIGWSTKYNKKKPRNHGILSATVGTLQMQLNSFTDDEILAKYSYILIDETHERDLPIDMTLYMLKALLDRCANRKDCPFVVLMSATFEPEKFIEYFLRDNNGALIGTNPHLNNYFYVGGQSQGHDEMWDWNDGRTVDHFTRAAADVAFQICSESGRDDESDKADILIFMPGMKHIKETASYLERANTKLHNLGIPPMSILKVDGQSKAKETLDYLRVFEPINYKIPVAIENKHGGDSEHFNEVVKVNENENEHFETDDIVGSFDKKRKDKKSKPKPQTVDVTPFRKCIISTNVAETGLTLSNLKYVIDAGFNKEIEFNPQHNLRMLIEKPAPVSRIKQRRGRSGRKFRGVFYPLYPKWIFDALPDQQFPQILQNDISEIVLDIIKTQLRVKELNNQPLQFCVEDLRMVDMPSADAWRHATRKVYALGFIDHSYNITEMGELATSLGMAPECARMTLAGFQWQANILDLITISAFITVMDPRDLKFPPALIWGDDFIKIQKLLNCDFILGLYFHNFIQKNLAGSKLRKLCEKFEVDYSRIMSYCKTRDEYIENALQLGLNIFFGKQFNVTSKVSEISSNEIVAIKLCIYEGFRLNLLTLRDGAYVTETNVVINTPALYAVDANKEGAQAIKPKYILYHQLGLKQNVQKNTFIVKSNRVCGMSGFVNIDINFI